MTLPKGESKSYVQYLHEANQRSLAKTGKPLPMPAGMALTYSAKGKPSFNANVPIGSKKLSRKPGEGNANGRGKAIVLTKRPKDYY